MFGFGNVAETDYNTRSYLMKLRVILIDENRGRAALLHQALQDAHYEVVAMIHGSEDLLTTVQQVAADIILIDMESPDRDTLESLACINRQNPKPIVMFSESDDSETIQKAVKAGVSAYIVDGLNRKRIKPIVEVAIARFREYQAMRRELEDVKSKLSERKIVERAKGILMQRKGLDEETAYHTLRKLAMDNGQRLIDVAQNVVTMAELLG